MKMFGLLPDDLDRTLATDEAHYAVRDHGSGAEAFIRRTPVTSWQQRVSRHLVLSAIRRKLRRETV